MSELLLQRFVAMPAPELAAAWLHLRSPDLVCAIAERRGLTGLGLLLATDLAQADDPRASAFAGLFSLADLEEFRLILDSPAPCGDVGDSSPTSIASGGGGPPKAGVAAAGAGGGPGEGRHRNVLREAQHHR